jgi:hypothetical protein
MIQNKHDSIAICRVFGPPDLFFTFTCNPKWPQIVNSFYCAVQKPSDKLDVIVGVYHMKLEELIQDIRSGKMFSPCRAGMNPCLFLLHAYICSLVNPSPQHMFSVLSCVSISRHLAFSTTTLESFLADKFFLHSFIYC